MELQATLSSSIRTNWFSLFASFFWFAWFSSPLYNSPSNEFVKTAAYMGISQNFTQLCVLRISANNLLLEINFVTRVSDTKKKVNFAVTVRDGKSFRSLFDILWIRPRTRTKKCVHSQPIDPSRNFQTKTVNQSIRPSIKRQKAIKGRKELKITARVMFCPIEFSSLRISTFSSFSTPARTLLWRLFRLFQSIVLESRRTEQIDLFSIFFKVTSNLNTSRASSGSSGKSFLHFILF